MKTSFSYRSAMRLTCLGMAMLALFWIAPPEADSQTTRAVQVTPDKEKRSLIRSVDGYAFLSEDMTLAETRATAFANAKRQAVEMVRTYIKSKTRIETHVYQIQDQGRRFCAQIRQDHRFRRRRCDDTGTERPWR